MREAGKRMRDFAIKGSKELDDTGEVTPRKAKKAKKSFEIQADAELGMMKDDLKERKVNEYKKLELEERWIKLEENKK